MFILWSSLSWEMYLLLKKSSLGIDLWNSEYVNCFTSKGLVLLVFLSEFGKLMEYSEDSEWVC